MNRIGTPLALTVALLLMTTPLSAGSHAVVYDHGTNTLMCKTVRQTSPCVVQVAEGDLIELSVINSSPSLVTASVTKIDLHAAERTMIQEKLFPTPPTNGSVTKSSTPKALAGTIEEAYEAVGIAIGQINEAISGTDPVTGGMNHYGAAKQELGRRGDGSGRENSQWKAGRGSRCNQDGRSCRRAIGCRARGVVEECHFTEQDVERAAANAGEGDLHCRRHRHHGDVCTGNTESAD